MAIPVSGVPDQNNKPSLVLFDSTASVTFAWEGSHTLGAAYVQIVDNSGTPIVSFGGGTQYTDAGPAAAHPVGTGIIFNNGGTYNFVSAAQPLPITGSLSITNPSTGSAVPSTANYIAASKSGTLTGLLMGSQTTANSLAVALASDQVSIPVTGTFWQATQPVSAASLPLPTGAATAAKQPALGTAGTASSDVITVQGIASMTALDVNIKSETAPAVTLTRVAIAASSSGDNTLIAAVSAKKIYVVAFELSFSGTVNAKFTDGAAGTNLGGLYYGVANAGAANSVAPDMKLATPSPYLWAGSTNTALILNLSGATAVGGAITYFTV